MVDNILRYDKNEYQIDFNPQVVPFSEWVGEGGKRGKTKYNFLFSFERREFHVAQ